MADIQKILAEFGREVGNAAQWYSWAKNDAEGNPIADRMQFDHLVVNHGTAPTQADMDRIAARLEDEENILEAYQFEYLLLKNGWQVIWDDVEAHLKSTDTEAYARLGAQKKMRQYRLSKTLAFLESVKPITDQLHPDADLSEATVRTAWDAAKAADI